MTTGLAIDDIMHELSTAFFNASKLPSAPKHAAIRFPYRNFPGWYLHSRRHHRIFTSNWWTSSTLLRPAIFMQARWIYLPFDQSTALKIKHDLEG